MPRTRETCATRYVLFMRELYYPVAVYHWAGSRQGKEPVTCLYRPRTSDVCGWPCYSSASGASPMFFSPAAFFSL